MNSEDVELWKLVTRNVTPIGSPRPTSSFFSPMIVSNPYPNRMCDKIDLHGLTLNKAHNATKLFIRLAIQAKLKKVVVITGRSGQICAEFPAWCSCIPDISSIRKMDNGGSYLVYLDSKKGSI